METDVRHPGVLVAESDDVLGHSTDPDAGPTSSEFCPTVGPAERGRSGSGLDRARTVRALAVLLLVVFLAALVFTVASASVRNLPTTPVVDPSRLPLSRPRSSEHHW